MTPAEYRVRCRRAESCLPPAEYRTLLTALHDEMLAEIDALRGFAQEVRRTGDTRLASMAIAALAQGEKK